MGWYVEFFYGYWDVYFDEVDVQFFCEFFDVFFCFWYFVFYFDVDSINFIKCFFCQYKGCCGVFFIVLGDNYIVFFEFFQKFFVCVCKGFDVVFVGGYQVFK